MGLDDFQSFKRRLRRQLARLDDDARVAVLAEEAPGDADVVRDADGLLARRREFVIAGGGTCPR